MRIAQNKGAAGQSAALVWTGFLVFALLSGTGPVMAAPALPRAVPNFSVIHLNKAQIKSLNIQTVRLKSGYVRSTLRLYGEIKSNPDGIFTLSSPLAGVVLAMPGKRWPQTGDRVIQGTSVAGIRPVVSTTLQITLALELTKVKADLAAARVAELTAAAAYRRVKSLYAQNEAVSLRRVQTAHAAFATAQGRVRADVRTISAISRQLKSKTGGFLPLPLYQTGTITEVLAHPGQAVAADQPLLRVEDFHRLLAAVALPASESGAIDRTAAIQVRPLGRKHWIQAAPLTIGPRADRQTRGLSLLYRVADSTALRPGMALTALVPQKVARRKAAQWAIIPRRAVVWWRGERWVYTARGGGVYALHELIHPMIVPDGYAVPKGSIVSRRVVSDGAQLLMTIHLSSTLKKAG